jgi:hypothetical protein
MHMPIVEVVDMVVMRYPGMAAPLVVDVLMALHRSVAGAPHVWLSTVAHGRDPSRRLSC